MFAQVQRANHAAFFTFGSTKRHFKGVRRYFRTMKHKLLLLLASAMMVLGSCSTEDEPAIDKNIVREANAIDRLADDLSLIAEQEYRNQLANAGGPIAPQTLFPACSSVTTTFASEVWTSVIDFGQMGCTLASGATVNGKMIIRGSIDFTPATYSIEYSFDNFHYNDHLLGGTQYANFSIESTSAQPDLHSIASLGIHLEIANPRGLVFQHDAARIRELVQGYQTQTDWSDNVYEITGSSTTEFPQGILSATIDTPLLWFATCPYIGQGKMRFTMDSSNARLDYGDSTCDYFALLTINAESAETVLLN